MTVAVALAWIGCGPGPDRDGGAGAGGASDTARTPAAARPDSTARAEEVTAMLRASAADWNAGDLEGFLDDYSAEPGLTFVGSAGVVRGLEEVRERYRTSYWAPGAVRDSLRFEEVEVRTLGEDHALALGRWILYRPRPDSVTASGWFTLVLRRGADGWEILHDHSS